MAAQVLEPRYLDRWEGKPLSAQAAVEVLRLLSGEQGGVATSPEHWNVTMALRAVLDRVPYDAAARAEVAPEGRVAR